MKMFDVVAVVIIFLLGVSLFVMADKVKDKNDKNTQYAMNVSSLKSSMTLYDWCSKNSGKKTNKKTGYNETVFTNANCKQFKEISK